VAYHDNDDDDAGSDDRELPDAADMDEEDNDDWAEEDSSPGTPVWIIVGAIVCLVVVIFLWLR
jgi:hypothetical protein